MAAAQHHASTDRRLALLASRPLSVSVGRTDDERGMVMGLRLTMVAAAVLLLPAAALTVEAQPAATVPRIGILSAIPISERAHFWEAFRRGLRELGYVEGRNITLVFPSGEVRRERLAHLAAELVSLKVDVIVTPTTDNVRAAAKATKTIPIVTPVIADPVATGLVASLARPGGNITGLADMSPDLSGKRLELLKSIVSGVSRIAVLSNPTAAVTQVKMREMEDAARALGVRLQPVDVRSGEGFETAFQAAAKGGAGALITLEDTLLLSHRARIVKLAEENRLPAVYGNKDFVKAGGLMSYGPNLEDMFRRAATYVDKILKGARPADLPIEQPTKFELVINLKTAKALGVRIPAAVLARADTVIE
jgi:putative tryptophan/tyrosine transport system substrate-binding protein